MLEEIVRTNNVPLDQPGDTPIRFHLPDLADLVGESIDILIRDINIKRRNSTLKRRREEEALKKFEQEKH